MINWFKKIIQKIDIFFRDRPASALTLMSLSSWIIPYVSEYRLIPAQLEDAGFKI